MAYRQQGGRFSDSAVPVDDPAYIFAIPAANKGSRNSLTSLETPQKYGDAYRESATSDASGFEPMQYYPLDDGEHEQEDSGLRHDPYQGITIDVIHHSINNHGTVMYHVDIKGPDGLLSTYTIRRRFRAFKNLHTELSRLVSEYNAKFDAVTAMSSPPFSSSEENIPLSPHTQRLRETREWNQPFPSLPSAGVWSYLKRHDVRLVEQRKAKLQKILRVAIEHPATKSCPVLESFLSVAPSEISQRGSSYVSLQDYSVPVVDRQRESIERKQRRLKVLQVKRQSNPELSMETFA